MEPRSELGILVGYPLGGKGYRLLNPKTFGIREYNVVDVGKSNVLQGPRQAEFTAQQKWSTEEVSSNNHMATTETTCEQAGPEDIPHSEGEPEERKLSVTIF